VAGGDTDDAEPVPPHRACAFRLDRGARIWATRTFRVGGKIFATLGYPDAAWGVVMLKPDQQALVVETTPKVFSPVPGGWGLKGSTRVNLAAADAASVKNALTMAWELRRAPSRNPIRAAWRGPSRAS